MAASKLARPRRCWNGFGFCCWFVYRCAYHVDDSAALSSGLVAMKEEEL